MHTKAKHHNLLYVQQWKNPPLRSTLQNIKILKNGKDKKKGEIS
jgi:hypothetical protein